MRLRLFAYSRDITILILLMLLSSLATNLVSPVWPIFIRELGASMTELGVITGLSNALGSLLQIPSGLLSDRYGRRKIHLVGTLTATFPPLLYTFTSGWVDLIPWVLLTGVGIGLTIPIRLAMVADETGQQQRAKAYSWFNIAFLVGPTIGPSIGGLVADLYGIRTPFLLACSFLAGSSVIVVFMGETHKGGMNPSVKAEKVNLIAVLAPLVAVFSANYTQGVATGFFNTVTPIFLSNRFSMDLTSIGVLYAVGLGLFPLVGQIPGGYLADRFERRFTIAVSVVASAPFFALFPSSGTVLESILYISLANGLLAFSWPALSALQVEVVHSGLWGFVNGIATSGWWAGMMTGSMLSGVIWDSIGMSAPYYAAGIATLSTAIPVILLKPSATVKGNMQDMTDKSVAST